MAEEDEYDDFEDVSDDEKRKIARHFLLSSPPGEIKHLLKELQVIIPAEVMNAEFLSGVFEKYNETNMVAMKTDEGTLVSLVARERCCTYLGFWLFRPYL